MIYLCMDTSHKYLSLSLIQDDKVIGAYQEECFKKQSETIFLVLDELCKKSNVKPLDIDAVVISKGPGSYTGVRIAMSVAKVMCALRNIPLYVLNTLKLYSAGNENTAVILDARGDRAYFGIYNKGKTILKPTVYEISIIKQLLGDNDLIGDCSLLELDDIYPNIANAFLDLKDQWELVENVHLLTPEYLKEASSYMVSK